MTSRAMNVTVANWQDPENLQWSFAHMDELFPTDTLDAGDSLVLEFERKPLDIGEIEVSTFRGTMTVTEILESGRTDAWAVIQGETLVAESYANHMSADTRHLLMSVSKSVLSLTLGTLVDDGSIELDATIGELVPALSESGYRDARVADLLDMRTGIRFSEDYLDPESEVRRLDGAVGWAIPDAGAPTTLAEFLPTLVNEAEHGGPFVYRSADTDVLGWLIETATGRQYADVAGDRVWSRIGAKHDATITVDPAGMGMFDGGISATLLDLARFAHLVLRRGRGATGDPVVSSGWIDDLFIGGPDSAAAFAQGPFGPQMPGGKYRRQFWSPNDNRDLICAVGIHGQLAYIDRAHDVIAVKFASQETPVDPEMDALTLAAFAAVSEYLADS